MLYIIVLFFVTGSFSFSFFDNASNYTFQEVVFEELHQQNKIGSRSASSVGSYNDSIFILGGLLETGQVDGTIRAYNMETKLWSIKCPEPCTIDPYTWFPSAGACSVQWKDGVYVFGGYLNKSTIPNHDLYCYNMTSNSLRVVSNINETKNFPTEGLSCAVDSYGSIYYYANESLFSFNVDTLNWTLYNTSGPGSREGSSIITYEKILVLFGGDEKDASVWYFNVSESLWTKVDSNGTGPGTRFNHLAVFDDTNQFKPQMIVYGGNRLNDQTYGDLWSFNLKNHTWHPLEANVTPISREKSNYVSNFGRIIIFGGEHNITHSLSDLWILIIESDCYEFGSDCFQCSLSIGCGWCNANPVGYQCVSGHEYAYINSTCFNADNNILNNFTKDYLMCPITGFPGWIVAVITLLVPIFIVIIVGGLHFYKEYKKKHSTSLSEPVGHDERSPLNNDKSIINF